MTGPQRIVCLTEEPTEVLYALGEQDRIVGISGFTGAPARARRRKPKVSAFTSAKIDEILKLQPDFVVGFSDIQADIAAELVRRGVEGGSATTAASRASSITCAGSARWSARATRRTRMRTNCGAGWMRSNAKRRRCRVGRGLFRGMGRTADHRHPLGRNWSASPAATTCSRNARSNHWKARILEDAAAK